MAESIRWGILSTGRIAKAFAGALQQLPDAELVGVGSRTQESAEAFGERYGVPRRYGSYEQLAADPDVQVVYIGTPHNLHMENTLLCLEGGKAVLCEKAFALNADEARRMIERARDRRLFLMEAMWTRYLPLMARVRQLLAEGAIGEVRMVQATFGFHAPFNPAGRLYNPALGGGTLLDIGIYPVSFATMVLGLPEQIATLATLGESRVDEQAGIVLRYPRGEMAVLATSFQVTLSDEAEIVGTGGRIRIHSRFHQSESATLFRNGEPPEPISAPLEGSGYAYEAAEVQRCLRAGKLESETMPLDESLAIMEILDEVRRQWGMRYPSEG